MGEGGHDVPSGGRGAFSPEDDTREDSIGPDDEAARTIAAWRDLLARGETVDFDAEIAARPAIARRLAAALATLRRLDPAFAAREAPATSPLVGATLGPYRIERRLGAGGMGEVFLATLSRDAAGLAAGDRVALKLVHAHLLDRPGFAERFEREARLGSSISHANVVRTLHAASVDAAGATRHVLAMEYVEGETLRAMLEDLDRLPEDLCRHVGREIAKGLAAIHAAGAVHRDLKPENVLVTKDHVVKVMDLGVARLAAEVARLSRTGVFAGSIHYAAPEQFRGGGKDADARADLFALGVVLYELATGAHPHAGDDLPAVMRRLLEETPRKPSELNPQLSPFFEEVVAKLLAKDPDARFASADELARVLADGEGSAWWTERSKSIRATTHRPLRRIRIPRETALYGRETELATLSAIFERVRSGDGQVVLIEGEAGIGKSRLVDEYVSLLHQQGHDVNFLFGSYPPGGAATAAGAFTSAYREHLGDDETSIRAVLPQTPLLAPAFAALLRGDAAPTGAESLTKASLQSVFVHATRAFAAERPTIVLIDDLHFAPDEGRALFASLALAVPGHRVLLVGCARPSLDEKWVAQLVARPQTTRIAVPRLGPKELVHLLRDALKSERLAEELSALIALKSDGNPFFVFELLRGLRDGQFLRQKQDGTWETTQIIRDIQVPSSIAELVQARVADLDAEDKNLLDAAACCGFEFDPLVVAAALSAGEIAALQRLARIEKRHRLVRSAGRRFVFDHHQVQEALYSGLPELLRERYHAAIAEAIEARSGATSREPKDVDGAVCVDLAEHYFMGAQGERAIRYFGAALDHLATGYLHDVALRLADRALAVPGLVAGRERCELLMRMGLRLDLLGRRDAQRAALEEAMSLADADGDATLRARALRSLGVLYYRLSRHDESLAVFRQALALARAAGNREHEAADTGDLGLFFLSLGRLAEAREHHERSLALAREIGDRKIEAVAVGNLGTVFLNLGSFGEAREHYGRCLALSREIGDREGEARATGNLANVYCSLGNFREAQEHCERSLALHREIGNRHSEGIDAGVLGNVLFSLGRLGEARENYERRVALSLEIGDRRGEAFAIANLGVVSQALGCFAEARERFERFLALSREIGDRRNEGFALQCLADLFREEGAADAAECRYAEALALRRELSHRDGAAETLVARGALLARQGRAAEARADLEGALALARELSLPGVELIATSRLAAPPAGPPDGLVPWSRALRDRPADDPARPADMVAAALAALAAHEGHAETGVAMESRFLLWQATRDLAHLADAKRRLDLLVEHAPADCRESMLANVRLHREIAATAREQGLPLAADGLRAGDERPTGSADA